MDKDKRKNFASRQEIREWKTGFRKTKCVRMPRMEEVVVVGSPDCLGRGKSEDAGGGGECEFKYQMQCRWKQILIR